MGVQLVSIEIKVRFDFIIIETGVQLFYFLILRFPLFALYTLQNVAIDTQDSTIFEYFLSFHQRIGDGKPV